MRGWIPLVGLGLFLLSQVACGPASDHVDGELPQLDREYFETEVQPLLAARCGNPSSCHGVEERPFALFVRGANRASARDVYRDPPLTAAELDANYERTRCFAVGGTDAELLTKPLAEDISGVWHRGETIFATRHDREYRTLEAWVLDKSTEEVNR